MRRGRAAQQLLETVCCALSGADPPPEDVPCVPTLDDPSSTAISCAMFVADFASHFSIQLGVRPVSFAQLAPAIAAQGELTGREPLWDLYEGLMRFVLNVRFGPSLCLSRGFLSLADSRLLTHIVNLGVSCGPNAEKLHFCSVARWFRCKMI